MLECNACLLRCLRAVCHDVSSSVLINSIRPLLRLRVERSNRTSWRHASSLAVDKRKTHASLSSVDRRKTRTLSPSVDRGNGHAARGENAIMRAVRSRALDNAKFSPDNVTKEQWRRLKLELPWLDGDRLRVLRRTKQLLKDHRQAEALELVKLASRQQECTIAWNAILEDLMSQHKVNEAFSTYNDVCSTHFSVG